MDRKRVDFGYNPPAGTQSGVQFPTETFVRDLGNVLDVAAQHFSSFWVSDHLMTSRFRMDVWTELTWIAARYPGPQLGTLVLCNSFRQPSLMAKMAASLQAFSRNRLILGCGAGWDEPEYRAYGYDFPSARVRVEQMVEAIRIMREMWTSSPAAFHGNHYHIDNAYCEPLPDPQPIVMIGGDGEQRTLRAVAEHADWWNISIRPVPVLRRKLQVLQQHCHDVGRDYASIRKTLKCAVILASSRSEAEHRAEPLLQQGEPLFVGEPEALIDYLHEMVDLGFDLFQFVFDLFPNTSDMRLFVDNVMPHFV